MTIQRLKKHTKDFAILYKQVINDRNLSYKAVGIWTYLMGLPDDWKINCTDLANRHTDGYKSTLSGLNELVAHGYAYKRNNQTLNKQEDGKFLGGCWVVFEEKTDIKEFENQLKKSLPHGPFGDTGNGDTRKGELLSIEEPSTEILSTKREREGVKPPSPPTSISKRKKIVEERVERAEEVSTTPKQHESLIKKLKCEKRVLRCYELLSQWKIHKSISGGAGDYRAILNWVINKLEEEERDGKDNERNGSKAFGRYGNSGYKKTTPKDDPLSKPSYARAKRVPGGERVEIPFGNSSDSEGV